MESKSEVRNAFQLLLLCTAVTVVLWFIPFAELVTFPIRLFVTYIHEAGHALAALGTLGSVNRIELNWSGGGVTETLGGSRFLISSAGYLTTTLFGAALLLILRRQRYARNAAMVTGGLLLLLTVLFGGNLLAWAAGGLMGGGLLWLGIKGRPKLAHFVMSFLGIQSLLNAFFDLRTLLYISAFDPGMASDAYNMSEATGGFIPPILWAFGWTLLSVVILAATLVVYYKSLKHRAELKEIQSTPLISEPFDSNIDRLLRG